MRPDLASSVGAERFLHEIRITALLRYPHILPVRLTTPLDEGARAPVELRPLALRCLSVTVLCPAARCSACY
jgi:hypothetical protein